MGELSPKVTERASPSPESRDTAISCLFGRAMLSPRLPVPVSILALSGASRQLSQRESLFQPQTCVDGRCIPPSHPAYTLIRARTGKEHHHGAESVPGRSACGGCGLHRQGGAAPRDRTTDLGLSAAGAAHRQVLRKAGGAAKAAGPRAADAGRIFALYRVLSGRRGGGAVPDRAEAALHQSPRAAQLCGHGVDSLRRGPDRIPQLPGRQPPPHRGAGGLRAGGERPRPAVHRGHHGPQRGRHRAEAGHAGRGAAGRQPRKARDH